MSDQRDSRDGDVAIVGMAGIFPRSPTAQQFWANILEKFDAVGDPIESWGAERYFHPEDLTAERIYTKAGGFLGDLYSFDPARFGIMPSSVDGGEPDQFLALQVAYEALADAGYLGREVDHASTGIILGHSTYLHRGNAGVVQHGIVLDQITELLGQLFPQAPPSALEKIRSLLKAKLPPFNADMAPGLVPNVMTGRIANRLNLKGPNYIVDAACASSLLAVHAAIEELRRGDSDLMLAGGVNASMPAEVLMVFTQLSALSRTSKVRPFDAEANGTLLGEGAGVVVLKRLEDALRDGDRIYATVKGVGVSSDGKGLGLLAPSLEGEALAIERAYRTCNVDPSSVGLIEAHGTGIPLGDKTEIQAISRVFGARDGELPRCAIGSVKSMISHCIPAAGIAGLIKAAYALYHKVLPPTLCAEVNSELAMDATPLYVNTEARPWVHHMNHPRRAGVNAFGFGGINTHVVLEEVQGQEPADAALAEWPFELLVLQAPDRDGLLARIEKVRNYVGRMAGSKETLRDLAATLAGHERHGDQRLAIVASSLKDLAHKLERASERLSDPARDRLQTRSGIYFRCRPMAGELAFMFPGEGSQYPDMLLDLAIHFPIVRHWFDFWESLYQGSPGSGPSAVVFPFPTGLGEQTRANLKRRLDELELGTEAAFIACQAMNALLTSFGLNPDAVVGHSSGENSALVASGAVALEDQAALEHHIMLLKRIYEAMESAGEVARGTMMTVGAVNRDTVHALVGKSAGALHLALDNCEHQAVIFGSSDAIETAATTLRRRGGLCSMLEIDRAYHTPLFEPAVRRLVEFYRQVPFRQPKVLTYSCATADAFTSDREEIRQLAAFQWTAPVRFHETIEKMYDDGVRYFVEAGPASNLTNFVGDILREKEHLAVSSDNRNRTGLYQLQHLLARLFVHGRELELGPLWARRATTEIDLDGSEPARADRRRPLLNTLPYIKLDPEESKEVAALLSAPREAAAGPATGDAVPEVGSTYDRAPAASAADTPASFPGEDPDAVMLGHLSLMQEFLAQQQHILGIGEDMGVSARPLPFLQRVLEHDETSVRAECDLDRDRDEFLRNHVLYASTVSDLCPDLQALAVVPLTVSLEMLVEVAALLSRQPQVVELRNITPRDWIALDEGYATVELVARRLGEEGGGERIHAAVYESGRLVVDAEVIFSHERAEPSASLRPLANQREVKIGDDELYSKGMFHGPLFQSVRHLIGWNETGMDLELADTDTRGFFTADDQDRPQFLLNPVLLDAVGQLTAFWVGHIKDGRFSTFPSKVRRIELLNPTAQRTEGCTLRGRLQFTDDSRSLCGDFDCVDRDGNALFRVWEWSDVYLDVPQRFDDVRVRPREGWLGEDWSSLLPGLPTETIVWLVPAFEPGFLEAVGAISRRLLAQTVLGERERAAWTELRGDPRRSTDWLMGRIAVKEAVRSWYLHRAGQLLYPADIVIVDNEYGQPSVDCAGLEALGPAPQISLAHANGSGVAIAGPPQLRVGIDLEPMGRTSPTDLLRSAFGESEQRHVGNASSEALEERVLRMWCAKEAAAKSLGTGLDGNPHAFKVKAISPVGHFAVVGAHGIDVPVRLCRVQNEIIAVATSS